MRRHLPPRPVPGEGRGWHPHPLQRRSSGHFPVRHRPGSPLPGPSSTIDFTCPDGDHIPIELRDGEEIKSKFFENPSALPEVKCYNPAFDVTDHELITAIVTEKGVCYPPFDVNLAVLFGRKRKEG